MSDGIAGITIQAKLFATQGEQAQRLAWLATNARHERFHPGTTKLPVRIPRTELREAFTWDYTCRT